MIFSDSSDAKPSVVAVELVQVEGLVEWNCRGIQQQGKIDGEKSDTKGEWTGKSRQVTPISAGNVAKGERQANGAEDDVSGGTLTRI